MSSPKAGEAKPPKRTGGKNLRKFRSLPARARMMSHEWRVHGYCVVGRCQQNLEKMSAVRKSVRIFRFVGHCRY